MLVLLFLFLLRLAVILARTEAPRREKAPASPPPEKEKPPQSGLSLRLLQGETKVWLKGGKGEDVLAPGRAIPVQGMLTLGRAPGNDLRLEDPFASAYHARIKVTRQGVIIEDLGTTNGTRVNGVRISGPVRTETGDIVDVGSTSFAVEE